MSKNDDFEEFADQRQKNILHLSEVRSAKSVEVNKLAEQCLNTNYVYNFDWLGVPIIQMPQDIIALQEIIWKTQPDVIIETGVARGGSIIFYASILHLLNKPNSKVIGVDVDIREHNRRIIESHPLSSKVNLIQGSSVDESTVNDVQSLISANDKVMIILDSNHTHDHVLEELELYSALVTKDCYLVVLDTWIEDMDNALFNNKPWSVGNNSKTAVHEFLKHNSSFEIDYNIHDKLVITAAHDGYLKRIR